MRKSTPLSNHSLRMPSQSRLRSSLKGCGAPAHAAAVQVISTAAETHVDLNLMSGLQYSCSTPFARDKARGNACYPARSSKNWMRECRQHRDPMRVQELHRRAQELDCRAAAARRSNELS